MFEFVKNDVVIMDYLQNIKIDIFQNAKKDVIPEYKPKEINWVWKYPELEKK